MAAVSVWSSKESKVDFADWSRDTWGAELTKKYVKIYSLHDENYFELLNIDSFEMALLAWLNFIQLNADHEFTVGRLAGVGLSGGG